MPTLSLRLLSMPVSTGLTHSAQAGPVTSSRASSSVFIGLARVREPLEELQTSTTRGKKPTIAIPGETDVFCPGSRGLHLSY